MSIIDVLKQRELQRLVKSENGSINMEKRVKHRAKVAKSIISGEELNIGVDPEIVSIRNVYMYMLEAYTQQKNYAVVDMNKQSVALWTRVAKTCKLSGVSPDRFMKAQFEWFNKHFGKAPELMQLATGAAIDRAKEFTGTVEHKIIGNNIEAKVSQVALFRQSENLLQQMMAAQKCSREEFYRNFVLSGVYAFPKDFLQADPVYKRVTRDIDE